MIPLITPNLNNYTKLMSEDTSVPHGHIDTEIDGSTCWIIFNNPAKLNALNTTMWSALPEIIEDTQNNDAVRVVILRGAGGKAFSAGADISEFDSVRTGDAAKKYDELNHAAFGAVMACTKPTIAMIEGYCMGGGLELALCCDLRYAAIGSSFAIPAVKLGVGYNPRWIRPLFSALSATQAKEVLFTGRRFSGEEAKDMGMITRLLPPDALLPETRALAAMITENAPLSVYTAKRTIDEFLRAPENPDMKALDALVQACFDSEDYAEGRTAFIEKRKPVFKGK